MTWNELLEDSEVRDRGGAGNPPVLDVTNDSRHVTQGAVFVAVRGLEEDGEAYVPAAVANGAAAVVASSPPRHADYPWATVDDPREAYGRLSRKLHLRDREQPCVVGVTGTNGKTTVTTLIHALLAQQHGAERAWLYGTVEYKTGTGDRPAPATTPEAADILRDVGEARESPQAIAMEVSSHALALRRTSGLEFDCAVWTNLTQDHLDFHATMAAYYEAKKLLFTRYLKDTGAAVVNIDDPWGKRLCGELRSGRTLTYGRDPSADLRILSATGDWAGIRLRCAYQGQEWALASPLVGEYNAQNLAAAWAAAVVLGTPPGKAAGVLSCVAGVPGRMETVPVEAACTVVVDYAHTPDALDNVLSAARLLTSGRLVCVFGCGGDRDRTKRPLMGAAAARHCDEAIVTSDNPRSEDPLAIAVEALAGIPAGCPVSLVLDRRLAIRRALSRAQAGDCVIVAGKGHESYQEVAGVRHPFDDRRVSADEAKRVATRTASEQIVCSRGRLDGFSGKRVTVLGAGASGIASARLLVKCGADVLVSDSQPTDELRISVAEAGLGTVDCEGDAHTTRVLDADLIVLSPGVPFDLPLLHEARRRGVPVWPEIELAFRCGVAPIWGVTGSTGKSTTVGLLGAILTAAGMNHVVAGNIGIPLVACLPYLGPDDVAVAELSSFQLQSVSTFRPRIAAVLNLYRNHLDRHADMEEYSAAKKRIALNMAETDTVVLNDLDSCLRTWAAELENQCTVLMVGRRRRADCVYLDGPRIMARVAGETACLLDATGLRLAGRHNRENAMVAAAVAVAGGVASDAIATGLGAFPGLPHRLEFVGEVDGVRFYNDSKATTAESVVAAVRAFDRDVYLIAGGRDKGCDFAGARNVVREHVRATCLIGEAAARIGREWADVTDILPVPSLADAVRLLHTRAGPGDVVLLSPGCSSFDMFSGYAERGDAFRHCVEELQGQNAGG